MEAARDVAGSQPGAVTVVRVDERVAQHEDLGSVLTRVPSAQIRRLGGLGDFSAVSLRAAGARQVLVLLDGVPLNPDGASAVNLAELPVNLLERVEVYRSGVPARLGAAPMGGSVSLVTATRPGSEISTSAGQLDTRRLRATTLAPVGQSDVLAAVEALSTEGDFRYFTGNGTPYELFDDQRLRRENNDKRQISGLMRLRTHTPWSVSLAQHWLFREEGLPGHANNPSTKARLETTRQLLSVAIDGEVGDLRIEPMAWALQRTEWLDDRAGEVGLARFYERTRSRSYGVGATATWLGSVSPALTVTARRDVLDRMDLNTAQLDAPRLRTTLTAALSTDAWLADERVRLTPSLTTAMLDSRQLGEVPWAQLPFAGDGEEVRLLPSPRLGVLWRVSEGLALKGTAGRSYRVPDLTELFGRRGALVGNANLRSETGWEADVGLAARHDGAVSLAAELGTFAAERTDAIVYVQNGQGSSLPVNFGHTSTRGVEAGLGARWRFLDSQTSFAFTHAVDREREVFVPRVPRTALTQVTAVAHKGLRLTHHATWQAGEYLDAANFNLSPPRALHSLSLRAEAFGLSAELAVLNLMDRTVTLVDRNPLDDADDTRVVRAVQDFNGYPLPGRTWMLTLRAVPPQD
ncbi:MAG: TonB-dependent receptor [Deltaproteobacteria bacterium]|nr:MAG: TonB-dependent receptor [Deltaproteobacteria bacterium]